MTRAELKAAAEAQDEPIITNAMLRAQDQDRIILLEGLLGEALDTCHLGDDAGLHKRMREALGLAT